MNQEINVAELAQQILAASKRRDPNVIQLEGAYLYVIPGRVWCDIKPVGLEEGQLNSLVTHLTDIGHRGYLHRSGYLVIEAPTNGEIDVTGTPADSKQELLLKSLIANPFVGSVEIKAEGMFVRPHVAPIVQWEVASVSEIVTILNPIINSPSAEFLEDRVRQLLWMFGLEVSGLDIFTKKQLTLTWGRERPCSELSAEKNILAQLMDFARRRPSVLTSFVADRELVIRFKK